MRYIKKKYPELALCSSKNKCARTDTVFFPISQVSTRGLTLVGIKIDLLFKGCITPMMAPINVVRTTKHDGTKTY